MDDDKCDEAVKHAMHRAQQYTKYSVPNYNPMNNVYSSISNQQTDMKEGMDVTKWIHKGTSRDRNHSESMSSRRNIHNSFRN